MKVTQLLLEYDRQKTIQNYGPKLAKFGNVDQILTTLEQTDPSINKQYVEWLCKRLVSGDIALDDTSYVTKLLSTFQKYKNNITPIQRDINKLTINDLKQISKHILEPNVNVGVDADTTDGDVKIWYKGPLGILASPLTKDAAKRLSKGTKWCTGAESEEHNKYDVYTIFDAKIYIWRDKNGKKYQFFPTTMEYKDEQNVDLDDKTIQHFKTHPVLHVFFDTQNNFFKSLYAKYIKKAQPFLEYLESNLLSHFKTPKNYKLDRYNLNKIFSSAYNNYDLESNVIFILRDKHKIKMPQYPMVDSLLTYCERYEQEIKQYLSHIDPIEFYKEMSAKYSIPGTNQKPDFEDACIAGKIVLSDKYKGLSQATLCCSYIPNFMYGNAIHEFVEAEGSSFAWIYITTEVNKLRQQNIVPH